jgi:hypothetical protein
MSRYQIPPTTQRPIAGYTDYLSAQRAVDYLSDEGIPVETVTIVGSGLRFEEHVTGRRGYRRAIGESAATGAAIGALLGFVFGLFSLVEPLVSGIVLALVGLLIGAVLGALLGWVAQAASGGQRDFSSASALRADRYAVLVTDDRADDAVHLLERMPSRR